MDAATYDRSGRLELDKFHIEPESGFTDPLRNRLGFIGGGIRSIPDLTATPYQIVYDLNEWFRFDESGTYRLYLTSPRVTLKRKAEQADAIMLTSNLLEFEIVKPEAGWAAQELRSILKRLDTKSENQDRRLACRALRFWTRQRQ